MADLHKELYAASCNPARRAKHSYIDDSPQSPSKKLNPTTADLSRNVPPILPRRSAPEATQETTNTPTVAQPTKAKRGRKPGPLSRTARETQRKLNHSIIEKARRTKINEALATLRELVPKDYGSSKDKYLNDDDDEVEENDGRQGKSKSKTTGKREEKEKEFKLEILVRTVSFMQDLLVRVQEMEAGAQPCSKCAARESFKRKRDDTDEGSNEHETDLASRLPKRVNHSRDAQSVADSPVGQRSSSIESTASRTYIGSRLPSISSWLPTSQIDPALLSPSQRSLSSNAYQLPSPPSSTVFHPVQTPHVPPALTLGPVATSSLLSPLRTPEDESAASLLLQISASSPQLPPVSSSNPCSSSDLSKLRTACKTPGKPVEYVQAQTPGSMLGLMQKMRG
jgi:Helix-loop-helix DNA-binding domain